MSTNFYTTVDRNHCFHCGSRVPWTERLHIGKSAGGWRFVFRVYEDPPLKDMASWKTYLDGRPITDEYGRERTADDFFDMIRLSARYSSVHRIPGPDLTMDGPADLFAREFS